MAGGLSAGRADGRAPALSRLVHLQEPARFVAFVEYFTAVTPEELAEELRNAVPLGHVLQLQQSFKRLSASLSVDPVTTTTTTPTVAAPLV